MIENTRCIYAIFSPQKNPGNLTVPGHLTLQYDTHEVYTKIYNYDLSISDYSMIVATHPDLILQYVHLHGLEKENILCKMVVFCISGSSEGIFCVRKLWCNGIL